MPTDIGNQAAPICTPAKRIALADGGPAVVDLVTMLTQPQRPQNACVRFFELLNARAVSSQIIFRDF